MIYKAVIIDNADLFTRGTVRIRIAGHYNRKIIWDLQDRFPQSVEEGDVEGEAVYSNDFDAILFAPFGGGRNYGSLRIPQINEKGVVAFLGGSKANPVWLGGLFEVTRNPDFDVDFVNFPSDKFEEGTRTDGIIEGESRLGDEIEPQEEKSFIIRTKHTTRETQEEIDFQQRDTSNLFTVGKQRVRLTHFPEGAWVVNEDESTEETEEEDAVIIKDLFKYKDLIIGKDEEGEELLRYIDKVLPTQEEADEGQGEIFSKFELSQKIIQLIKKSEHTENGNKYANFEISDDKAQVKRSFELFDEEELKENKFVNLEMDDDKVQFKRSYENTEDEIVEFSNFEMDNDKAQVKRSLENSKDGILQYSNLEMTNDKAQLKRSFESDDEIRYSNLEMDDQLIILERVKEVDGTINKAALELLESTGEISITKEDVKTHSIGFNDTDITINKTNMDEDKITTITMGEESLSLKVVGDDEVNISVDGTDVTIKTPDVTFSISGTDVTVTAANFHFDGDAFKIAGGGDSVSLYTPLEKILDKLLNHNHVAPSGPTTPAQESNNTPLSALKADLMKIESKTSTTD